jgi:hypothetical protein
MLEAKISNFIEQQFPNIYREEGQFFVEFLKQYYVWLETDSTSPVYQARRYVSDHDIDSTVDSFLVHFKEKYLRNIQLNTATNTKQLIKNSIDLYRSKGTEEAIRLFFDLIFSEESEVYYPGTDVFRLSDSDWVIPSYIEVTSKPANRLLVGRSITGASSGATAFVESLVRRRVKNTYVEVLYISAVSGAFITGEIIRLTTPGAISIGEFPNMIGSLNTLEVLDGGTGFERGETVRLESRTGEQGQAFVQDLVSITGLVDFDLIDGGWGYTSNAEINVSEKVLFLDNVKIESTTNTSLHNLIVNIEQPTANVQWYGNNAVFSVGDKVYNYYANGELIGVSEIISAEYGTSNTTNFFLLSIQSGENYMDEAAKRYYKAGNTEYFDVQTAGHTIVGANGVSTGFSSNATIYGTGSISAYLINDYVVQYVEGQMPYAEARVLETKTLPANTFSMKVTDINGLFLTNKELQKLGTNSNVSISHLKLELGVRDIQGNFNSIEGNVIKDTYANSLFSAAVYNISSGAGANVNFDEDMTNTETVLLNTNMLRDHMDEANTANHLNASSYGAALNSANLTFRTLDEALRFESKTLGTISRLINENPGTDYGYPPIIEVIDPLVAPLMKMDFVIKVSDATGVFKIGERVTQALNGGRGQVKFANTSEVHLRRLTYSDKWTVGNANTSYLLVGESSGFSAYPTEVTSDVDGIAGRNSIIEADTTSSNSAALTLKVVDSGFGFTDTDEVFFTSMDSLRTGSAIATVKTHGTGMGYYRSTSGFLSSDKYIYDGDYYQDFSYEIRSPITASRYVDMLKHVLHVAGTKSFSSILKSKTIDSKSAIAESTLTRT